MKAIEWVTAELKKKDAALGSYLARFKKENEQLDEAALAEKLNNDPLFSLMVKNASLSHSQKTASWVMFIGVVVLISCVGALIIAAATLS